MKNKFTVLREKIVADFITPVSGYMRLGSGEYSFLLESAEKGKAGRFSFIGARPSRVYELYRGYVRILREKGGVFTETRIIRTTDPLGFIQRVQDEFKLENENRLPPFCGGLVGCASYDIIESFENITLKNRISEKEPLAVFLFSDEVVAFDHLHNTAQIIKLISEKDETESGLKRIEEIKRVLNSPVDIEPIDFFGEYKTDYTSNFSRKEFEEAVRKIKLNIKKGEIIQGVLSQRLTASAPENTFDCYRALRVINPSPYMFYIKMRDTVLCGSSPEVMVKTSSSKASLKPIAGTRRRSRCPDEEKKLKKDLQGDPKEIAEHIMLVDLGRNDLSRVCLPGSVRVKNMMEVEKYSHVMHMVTEIEGEVKKGAGNTDVFKSCFPAGTVSGAPKLRAIQIIDSLENLPRGPYAGAAGYFSFTGDMDMAIAIRTMVLRKGKAFIQAGAGIVADSVPGKEYTETMNKAGALLQALAMAAGEKNDEK